MQTVLNMNCLDGLRLLGENSVDAIVTDPPYGLSFMGKKWDYDVPSVEIWAECLRVLKPGGHMLAFAGTRTQHRMAVRIEDAGFEIRDMIAWVYGSGFPKSHNGEWGGTALKPAMEPITMARKSLAGTVEKNWREQGTGALNIDACRVGTEAAGCGSTPAGGGTWNAENCGLAKGGDARPVVGRWPANLIHDGSERVLAAFPESPLSRRKESCGPYVPNGKNAVYGAGMGSPAHAGFSDVTGSTARFFYCAKASRTDRNDGCEAFAARPLHWSSGDANPGSFQSEGTDKSARNPHPTVKPTDLMRYLCRLVTPPGGLVLDPFTGSGSTGRGARLEGFSFLGFELDPHYAAIARARIEAAK